MVEEEEQQQQLQWLELERLLCCMERREAPLPGQSWQSLLLRAQYCQELWQQLSSATVHHHHHDHDHNTDHNNDDDNDSQQQQQQQQSRRYIQLSQKVDQVCRRAHEMAEIYRLQQQQKQKQESSSSSSSSEDETDASDPINSSSNSSRGAAADIVKGDLIDRIFFKPLPPLQEPDYKDGDDNHEDDNNTDDDDDDVFSNGSHRNPQETGAPPSSTTAATTTTTAEHPPSLKDLQQAQREQMEEAIALMAAQMKEATQGIHSQLQQQTEQTLTELETVAEQNVQDVTKIATQTQQHNQHVKRRNWGTWSLLLLVVGVFCAALVTILTIPKRPNTCLIYCHHKENSSNMFGWLTKPALVVGGTLLQSGQSLWVQSGLSEVLFGGTDDDADNDDRDDHDNNDNDDRDDKSATVWKKLYDEDEAKRLKKEELAELVSSLTNGDSQAKKKKNEKEAIPDMEWRQALDDDDQVDPEDTESPFGGRQPVKPRRPKDRDENDIDDNPFGGRESIQKKDERNSLDDLDDNPFGGRPPVAKKKSDLVHLEDDPFGGRQPVPEKTNKRAASTNKNPPMDDNPFGDRPPVGHKDTGVGSKDSDNPFGDRKQIRKVPLKAQPKATTTQDSPKEPKTAQDVNMADLFASLNQAAQKKEVNEAEAASFTRKVPRGSQGGADTNKNEGLPHDPHANGGGAVAREGAAKLRISPRDVRTAADIGNLEKLHYYLEHRPEFVHRYDKNQWTPLHLAARSGKVETVQVLIDTYHSPINPANNIGHTPLDVALERLGSHHKVVKILRQAGATSTIAIPEELEEEPIAEARTNDPEELEEEPKAEARTNDPTAPDEIPSRRADNTSQDDSTADDSKRLKLQAKQEALQQALLEASDEQDDGEDSYAYVQNGRRRLEASIGTHGGGSPSVGAVSSRRRRTVDIDDEGKGEEDPAQYLEAGRNRLDAVLGATSTKREEL